MNTFFNNLFQNKDNYFPQEKKIFIYCIGVSIILHVIIIIIPALILYFTNFTLNERNGMIEFSVVASDKVNNEIEEKENEINEPEKIIEEEIEKDELITEVSEEYLQYSGSNADTTQLDQVYSEPTLNVSVRYPAGWIYLDQNKIDKLDGVTFWSSLSKIVPPPYIHIEVKEKYLFNEMRFQYQKEERNFILYYNNPEEMEGQFTQIVYLRTKSSEDYTIKLIIYGEEAFRQYQPVFFGMVKTFSFGKSLF